MPQKTIYVKDENTHLYDRAEALSGETLAVLLPRILKEYIDNEETRRSVFAVCLIDERADEVPYFRPEFFVEAPVGTTTRDVRLRIIKSPKELEEQYFVIPLIDAHPEIIAEYQNATEQDIVLFISL